MQDNYLHHIYENRIKCQRLGNFKILHLYQRNRLHKY